MTRERAIIAVALFLSYAYFYQAGGWNQNSRFALVRAIVERHTLQIDAYAAHTGDIAFHGGHYYSDKAPGTSLTALAPAAVARWISRAAGVDPESFPGIAWTSYAATVITSGLFTVVGALAIMWIAAAWGYSNGAAVFAATAYGVATPAWCYATLFMGHNEAAGCLMLAFAAAIALDASARARRLAWLLGLAGGWAVVTEFQTAVPLAFIVLLAMLIVRDSAPEDALRVLGGVLGGGAIAAAILGAYNAAAFGSPFHLGYASERGFEQLRQGLFGITYPQWWRVRELLVGSYRGLLPIAPLMAAAPLGLYLMARRAPSRHEQPSMSRHRAAAAIVAAAIPLYYLVLNASYYYWEGGWIFGPRQMSASFPFLCLGLLPLWDRGRGVARALLIAGWVWGAAVTFVAVSTTPQPPSNVSAPLRDFLWPAFRDGDLSLNHQTFVHHSASPDLLRGGSVPHAAWNLGEIAHLRGLISLVPLGLVWLAAALALARVL